MEELIEICNQIADLCNKNYAKEWAICFYQFADELKFDDWNVTKRKIKSVYAGMSSFNDLVLQKDGIIFGKQTEVLSVLRTKLYKKLGEKW